MMIPPAPTPPLPVLQILSETARLHWTHILVFLAAAALFAIPMTLALMPVADDLLRMTGTPTPEAFEHLVGPMMRVALLGLALGAVLFAFWARLTLMGPRAALAADPGGWPLRSLKVAGLLLLAWITASLAMMPISAVLGLMGGAALSQYLIAMLSILAMAFFYALFSRWMVESALDIRRASSAPRPAVPLAAHVRLAALLTAVILGLIVIQTVVHGLLVAVGAELTARVAGGIFMTLIVTTYASIHAIVYRLRTVPPGNG